MNSDKIKNIELKRLFEFLVGIFYVWYFLPICQALFWNNSVKYICFGCFAVGIIGLLFLNGIRLNAIIVAVGGYLLIFSMLYLLNVDDANAHIRISFTFWGTALLYFGILDDGGRIRIGKVLLFLYAITVITSSIGVIIDDAAARTLAHAAADDTLQTAYKMKNIASIYLFQCLICFVPILIFIPKQRKQKMISIILLTAILLVLMNASFTISLIVFVVAVVLSILLKGTGTKRMLITVILGIVAIAFLANGSSVLYFLSSVIDNEMISVRLAELAAGFSSGNLAGDAGLRLDLYVSSLTTFFENPFGVGAHYSYHPFENGIGYHSQLLDDMARYGIFALAFYITFIVGYYKHLRRTWHRLNCPQVAAVVTSIYVILLILNLSFRSADESIVMLFIMPVLPQLIEKHYKKTFEKAGSI